MGLTFDEYQRFTHETAVYPYVGSGHTTALAYLGLGLAGEAGEVANKIKKLIRDGDDPEMRHQIRTELGDVIWYLARLSDELGTSLKAVAASNRLKLQSRKDRGVIGGSGDHR